MIRGDVLEIFLPRGQGHVQHGRRHAVVVQADDLMTLSTALICPTSQSTPSASFHPEIQVRGESTRVMCEMVRAFDVRKVGKPAGHLRVDEMARVDEALSLVLDLPYSPFA
jgi:mRNA-degrading endonuclease toxin of MazEF toxin-antitoxin module